jgi:hypothetical protein
LGASCNRRTFHRLLQASNHPPRRSQVAGIARLGHDALLLGWRVAAGGPVARRAGSSERQAGAPFSWEGRLLGPSCALTNGLWGMCVRGGRKEVSVSRDGRSVALPKAQWRRRAPSVCLLAYFDYLPEGERGRGHDDKRRELSTGCEEPTPLAPQPAPPVGEQ